MGTSAKITAVHRHVLIVAVCGRLCSEPSPAPSLNTTHISNLPFPLCNTAKESLHLRPVVCTSDKSVRTPQKHDIRSHECCCDVSDMKLEGILGV